MDSIEIADQRFELERIEAPSGGACGEVQVLTPVDATVLSERLGWFDPVVEEAAEVWLLARIAPTCTHYRVVVPYTTGINLVREVYRDQVVEVAGQRVSFINTRRHGKQNIVRFDVTASRTQPDAVFEAAVCAALEDWFQPPITTFCSHYRVHFRGEDGTTWTTERYFDQRVIIQGKAYDYRVWRNAEFQQFHLLTPLAGRDAALEEAIYTALLVRADNVGSMSVIFLDQAGRTWQSR